MLHKIENRIYKSPLHKLVRFFEKSRDGWKEKHGKAKIENKYLQNRIRYLERTELQWKQETLELRKEIARLETEKKKEKLQKRGKEKKEH